MTLSENGILTLTNENSPERHRLVSNRFSRSFPCCSFWLGFDEFAVHQWKDGRKLRSVVSFLPPSQKALRALVASPYSNAIRNKWVATGYESVNGTINFIKQSGKQVLLLVNFRVYARRSSKGPEEAPIYIVQSERTTSSRRKMKGNVFKF